MSQDNSINTHKTHKAYRNLIADCEKCFGLCCVALYFAASEGFPNNKDAGQPCINLQPDFRCSIHQTLREKGMKGCMAFDCFGAGQKVSQISFSGLDWRKKPESAMHMFEVFLIMRQLHELVWYLTEALTLEPTRTIHEELQVMLAKTELVTGLSPEALLKIDVAAQRAEVNALLLKTSELVRAEALLGQKTSTGRKKSFGRGANLIGADLRKFNLRGSNLRGAYLIAADLRGTDLTGTDFIGADLRDADLRGADLTKSLFLTQAQINTTKGDNFTKIRPSFTRPRQWDA
ncbi:hypothetical protein DP73_13460 [Desulfosporosinus sp. HMP52]|uniref:pentapeptide repeat-containing protein n=1 Tax=Desulfosporosinus sp. HMP52 TaxID=1487923 RepID=UPI00051F94A6|nr:pentapeptide repeat-containing protein [Desulfosporosinus sp. HMP52]KGK88106.1 hypothetical protein DP73_13460 [Desulfosporosinus sp. HMP52]